MLFGRKMNPEKSSQRIALLLLICVVLAVFAASFLFLPIPISFNADFFQFYCDLLGISHGQPIYDQRLHAESYAHFYKPRFPPQLNPPAYPPWYYIVFLPLTWFSIEVAAKLWALANLVFLVISAELLTRKSAFPLKAFISLAILCFAPVIGHLVVGQQTIILVLGAALFGVGAAKNSAVLVGMSAALLTFKPHLGIPILFGFYWAVFIQRRTIFVRSLSWGSVCVLVLVFASLVADPASLFEYPKSLHRLSELSLNRICDTCSSLTFFIDSQLSLDAEDLWLARLMIASLLALTLAAPLLVFGRGFPVDISTSIMIALLLLIAPYARNYDYVLMIYPLITGIRRIGVLPHGIKRGIFIACISMSYLLSGIVPFIVERSYHRDLLWISALLCYAGFWCFLPIYQSFQKRL